MLDQLNNELNDIRASFDVDSKNLNDINECQTLKVKYLGKKGALALLFQKLGKVDKNDRPAFGKQINLVKVDVLAKLEKLEAQINEREIKEQLEKETIDITLPGMKSSRAAVHPLYQTHAEMVEIFREMGYEVAEGPELEEEFYNFDALNFPPDHPAKDMQDTFYIDQNHLLRTHTSPVQVRMMKNHKPPMALIAPGKVYRCDADITHSPMFMQVEGLLIDKNVTFADLKGTLKLFLETFFRQTVDIRLRPSFFPFTEPSAEVDISCIFCKGSGCNICKDSGWLEVLGCGMVDPNVFKSAGIDSEVYQGFAFGMGVDRFAMLKYGINNIRLFYENRNDFLAQF